jgi:hypothetical protein
MTDEKRKLEEELNEEELEDVSGGATGITGAAMGGSESGALPPTMGTSSPGGSVRFPNTTGGDTSDGDGTTSNPAPIPQDKT